MTTDPTQLREEIEITRASLSDNVDALTYQANPAHVARRQVNKAKAAGNRLLDRLLGKAEEVKEAVVGGVSEGAQQVSGLPEAARRQTQGSPMAAGAVAFGIGLLIAGAFPPSRREAELAQSVKEQAQPLAEQVTASARAVASSLAEPAQEAMTSVRQAAAEGAERVKAEGDQAVAEVRHEAGGSQ